MGGSFEEPRAGSQRQPMRRLKDVMVEGLELFDLLKPEDKPKIEAAAYAACSDPDGPCFKFEFAEPWQARSFVTDALGNLERAHFKTSKGSGYITLVLEGRPFYRDTLKQIAAKLGCSDVPTR